MNLNARLKKLEPRRSAAPEPFRVVISSVWKPTNLKRSTCTRTVAADGSLMEWFIWTGAAGT